MLNKLKWLGLGLLVMTLSSCMTAYYATGRLRGYESPMQSDFPVGNMTLQSESLRPEAIAKKARFALLPEQNDFIGPVISKRLEQALQAKGYELSKEGSADYILAYSYSPTKEGTDHSNEAYLKVKVWKNTSEKPLIWEAIVQNAKDRSMLGGSSYNWQKQGGLLSAYRSSTFYGDFHFLKMDYFIAAIVDHLGKEVANPDLEMHPKDFRYLSQAIP
jgi:hypothetical protein